MMMQFVMFYTLFSKLLFDVAWPKQSKGYGRGWKTRKTRKDQGPRLQNENVGNGQMSLTSEVKTNNTIELKDLIQPHKTNIVNW